MTMVAQPLFALILLIGLMPSPALAADLQADAPVATAPPVAPAGGVGPAPPAPAAGRGVADQIDAYLKSSPAVVLPDEQAQGVTSSTEPRKIHGEVSLAVGTGGYRDAYARSDIPVGKTGTLSIAVEQGKTDRNYGYGRFGGYGGYGGGYGYGRNGSFQNLGVGLALGGSGQDSRCRAVDDNGQSRARSLLDHDRDCPPTDLLPLDP